ncbi:Plastid ribosomal protein L10, imported to chloroplast, large ribosomal subunit [Trebouxia sp. C0010 RCD-2024]
MNQTLLQSCLLAPQAGFSGRIAPSHRQHSSASFTGSPNVFHTCSRLQGRSQRSRPLTIQNALSRAQKEQTVEKLERAFEKSAVVYGMRFKNLSVKQMTEFRQMLPSGAVTYVCKNTLLRVAAEKQGWETIIPTTKGENAWVFVSEECIGESVKAYHEFEKKLLEKYPKEQRAEMHPTSITGASMENQLMDLAAFKRLEKMPTKIELIATIARLLNQVPRKIAVSIKQVPAKVAFGVKALADGDDNKDAIVSDVFPKPAA